VCDQSSVYCGVFVVTVDNFSFGCRFVFASNRFRRFPDWLLSTKLTNDVGSHRETTFWWIWNHLVDNSVDSFSATDETITKFSCIKIPRQRVIQG
jgi:hypothetical protein